MMTLPRFHLAFPVNDLFKAREFYSEVLGCGIGRHSDKWMDFNLYGHQIVAHLSPEDCAMIKSNEVDGDSIPSRHFGVILSWGKWEELINVLKKKQVEFLIQPRIRFKNKNGEQGTFFINDPSGNVLEFKSFKNDTMIFQEENLKNVKNNFST
ncbi:MAG: glyoxalase [Candidatus Marinimicrobia bacterium]|nr:glyoxalase [Candidatus Neomarinimicrobiota bacterium]|tara:strand:- start:889 stop:1347 length:459 start_codon:yes stop_codon:yes gene_type:complete